MLRATIVSVSGENDKNLINFIASTVEAMRDQMATKADIAVLKEQMATKAELASVKDDLASVKDDLASVKDDLASVKDDLALVKEQMSTKTELAAVKEQMVTKIDLLETTMHGEFEQVHLRLDSIDRSLSNRIGQVESEVSRLRSVIYWLVKDKPDMLRLLGQPTPGENRPQG
jgi:chromosome segregation ATPase